MLYKIKSSGLQLGFTITAQKVKFSIKDFFSKYDQIRRKLWIWLHLLKKSIMENFIFCAVYISIALKLAYNKNKLYKTLRLTIDPEINSILIF